MRSGARTFLSAGAALVAAFTHSDGSETQNSSSDQGTISASEITWVAPPRRKWTSTVSFSP